MELATLESLVATIRTGSFSAAARELGIPKSTVANRICKLETQLDARLLERTTRLVRPTEEGAALYMRAEQILFEARDLQRSFGGRGGQPHGTLRVSVPVLFEQAFMGRTVAALLARHPGMGIEVVADDRRVDIVGEGFDCAIRAGALSDSSATARLFAEARNVIVAAPALAARLGRLTSPVDLEPWPMIWHGRTIPGRKLLELVENGRPISVEVKPSIVLGSSYSARTAAVEGLGAAVLPNFFVDEQLKSGSLVSVAPEWLPEIVPLSVIYPAHRLASPRVRALIDILSEQFRGRRLVP